MIRQMSTPLVATSIMTYENMNSTDFKYYSIHTPTNFSICPDKAERLTKLHELLQVEVIYTQMPYRSTPPQKEQSQMNEIEKRKIGSINITHSHPPISLKTARNEVKCRRMGDGRKRTG